MITLNVTKYFNGGTCRNILGNRLSQNIICISRLARSMSTVDSKEIKHFSDLENNWWDKNGPIKGLHTYNPLRIQFVKDGLTNAGVKLQNSNLPLKGIKIVDVGCGGGILAEALAEAGAQVTGIDASAELINIAKEHVKLNPEISERVNYIQTTVEEFVQKEKETYDVVISSEVLEHTEDPQLFLKECVKTVKPGKSIFITTINKTLKSFWSTIVLNEYVFKVIPRGTHQWNKFIAPQEVQRILKNYGCETKLIRGANLNPKTAQWSQTSSLSTFYGLHAIKQKETGA
ncbi:PREDICTED: hexaprenyldihydroxybenzoate methyltransferase, mitochondrial-like [Vollenhovia emeryi]|uniref:hexaprenyldihydroxybenzoate methyltransferase, mitochondrial-like n=1 Tax=Vollenhovia emeryi TaxID=411798 RepID=UPI0005F3CE1F|nr:PREDICTED: hexaprenyldihydroxybenzoate methyltransferase, mitochondrial-like [Vollenhovia emeryi]